MSLFCSKPNRKVEVEGDLLRITLKRCLTCEECRDTQRKMRPAQRNNTERRLKAAYWRIKSQQREIVEIISLD